MFCRVDALKFQGLKSLLLFVRIALEFLDSVDIYTDKQKLKA